MGGRTEFDLLVASFPHIQREIIFAILECEAQRFMKKMAPEIEFLLVYGFRINDTFVK